MKLPRPRPGEAIKADHIRQLSDAIRAITPRPSRTINVIGSPNGTAFETVSGGGGGGGGIAHAWKPRLSRQEGTTDYIIVSPGTFAGEIPKINTTFLYDEPELSISNAATTGKYVYIHASLTLTVTDGFINGYTIDDLQIEAFSGLQTNDDSNFYHLLFSWSRDSVVQYSYWSQGFVARDDGTATTTPMYYSWSV